MDKSQDVNSRVMIAEIDASNTNGKGDLDLINTYQSIRITKNVPSNSRFNFVFRYSNDCVVNMILLFAFAFYLNKYPFA